MAGCWVGWAVGEDVEKRSHTQFNATSTISTGVEPSLRITFSEDRIMSHFDRATSDLHLKKTYKNK